MSFLAALKQNAPKPSFASQATKKQTGPITVRQFINAAQSGTIQPAPTPEPIAPIELSIDRVIGKNRIDLQFSHKPDQCVIDKLKQNGFWWDGIRKVWFHKDTPENRTFLMSNFGATFDSTVDQNEPEAELVEIQSAQVSEPIGYENVSPEFATYKKQVDALINHLGMTPADLMVYAIGELYRNTIAN